MKKQRILHLLPSNSFSGAENVVCTIIENDKDYDMYYCCPNGPIKDVLKERKIKYLSLDKFTPKQIKKVCMANKIDILHAHDYKASYFAALSGFKGKVISHLHSNWDFSKKWNLYTILYKFCMRKFYKIITVSQEVVDDAIFAKKIKNKFNVITNVVSKRNVIEKSKEFKTEKYDIVFLGRLIPVKRPLMVIEIVKELKKSFPNIKACIIGDGQLYNNCKLKIQEYGLQENIDLLGFKKNPFPYVKNSKVALLTSTNEGLPMSVIECMILDTPVLNSGVGGLLTLFRNNEEFICENIDDYCKKISLILKGNNSFVKACSNIIKEATDMDLYIKKINYVYK